MAWKTEEGPRLEDRDPGHRGRNPDPGDRDLEDGSWSDLVMEYFSPTVWPLFSGFMFEGRE